MFGKENDTNIGEEVYEGLLDLVTKPCGEGELVLGTFSAILNCKSVLGVSENRGHAGCEIDFLFFQDVLSSLVEVYATHILSM